MASKRKLWSTTTTLPSMKRRRHESCVAAYRHVEHLVVEFCARTLRPDLTHVTVWVDTREGYGWRRYERLSLAELAQRDTPAGSAPTHGGEGDGG